VGETLNLKENQLVVNQVFESVPVNYFTKVYNFSLPQEGKLKKNQNIATKQSTKFHFNELDYMEKPFYVLKTSEIFPYDAEQIDSKNLKKTLKDTFRPEFLCNFDTPLKSDTLKDFHNLALGHKDQSRFVSRQKDI
jgi:hypothetical protein